MRMSAWRMLAYASIVLFGILTALPNLLTASQLSALPDWWPKQQLTLGLDLRGGAHVVLELDTKSLLAERTLGLMRQARVALKDADIDVREVSRNGTAVVVRLNEPGQGTAVRSAFARLVDDPAALDIRSDGLELRMTFSEAGKQALANAAAEQSLEIIRTRLDGSGLAEPALQRVGRDRLSIQLPGVTDMERIKKILGSTAKLTFHMVRDAAPSEHLPPGVSWRTLKDAGQRIAIEDRVMLEGDRLTDAKLGFDPSTGEPVVTFRFDAAGAQKFAQITKNNVGKPFAILLDGDVLTAPVIQSPIIGGTGQILGNFTPQSASDLAALLRAGALPVEMTIVQQQTVTADAGRDAIEKGVFTGVIGLGLVLAFIALLYGRWGFVANLALVLNVVLTFAALTLLGATLTLPGIAGIVLGIGLAVDANVLINERIREETRKGLTARAALDAGFKRAFATIVDSNLTALIATALLFMFGTGPVRGFAVTMGLGIAISMFTAVTVVRVIMEEIVRRSGAKTLTIEPLFCIKLIPDNTAIPFMRARVAGIAVSAVLSLASLALFATPGLNYGVDFKGGIQLDVVAPSPIDIAALRGRLDALNLGEVSIQEAGGPAHMLIRVEQQADGSAVVDRIRAKVVELAPAAQVSGEAIGPRVSAELASTGILAVVLASLAMLVYIWVRFEWQFAVGAIATLVLDVTKTVGFFALTGLEFNLTAIAALLTLIGYSVNDKVVVYDRMRENMRKLKSLSLREIIDRSINETLGRSLYTSVTALVAMLPMAIWGGSAVASFAIPMVFGIVIAASSSVFIAAPILLFLGDWRSSREGARSSNQRYRPLRGAVERSSPQGEKVRVGGATLEGKAALP